MSRGTPRPNWLSRLSIALICADAFAGDVIYVDASASPGGDGQSWATAFPLLQDGIAAAVAGQQVWVANGLYHPAPPSGPRAATFQLKNGVAIYGGFAGDETSLEQRDPITNPVVLSGDLNGNDVEIWLHPSHNDNSYHVVVGSNNDATAILDGVTITAGNAIGAPENGAGGGIFADNGNPQIVNCIVTYNWATRGGGLASPPGNAPTLVDCSFVHNRSEIGGGAVRLDGPPNFAVIGCRFEGNISGQFGAVVLGGGNALIMESEFIWNICSDSLGGGGALYSAAPVTIEHCTFTGNVASAGGAIVNSGALTAVECLFDGNIAGTNGGGAIDLFSSSGLPAQFTNCVFRANTSLALGGAIQNDGNNATFINCLLAGNYAKTKGGAYASDGPYAASFFNCTVSENVAGTNGGGFHKLIGTLAITNSIVWGNMDSTGTRQSAQITFTGLIPSVNYTCVQGLTGTLFGTGNIGGDPLFMNPTGIDGIAGTPDDDFHLAGNSPCENTGNNAAIPPGIETDLDGNPRIQDGVVDMGAFERTPTDCPADIANAVGDGFVNVDDLLTLIGAWGSCPSPPRPCPADIDDNGAVYIDDLLAVINAWGPCP